MVSDDYRFLLTRSYPTQYTSGVTTTYKAAVGIRSASSQFWEKPIAECRAKGDGLIALL